jgi:hypothetical protein
MDDSGTYRVLYLAPFADSVYVLHASQEKTRATRGRLRTGEEDMVKTMHSFKSVWEYVAPLSDVRMSLTAFFLILLGFFPVPSCQKPQ